MGEQTKDKKPLADEDGATRAFRLLEAFSLPAILVAIMFVGGFLAALSHFLFDLGGGYVWKLLFLCLCVGYIVSLYAPIFEATEKKTTAIQWIFMPYVLLFPFVLALFPMMGLLGAGILAYVGFVIVFLGTKSKVFRSIFEGFINAI